MSKYKVLRGGSFLNSQGSARSAFRLSYPPHYWYSFVGFRLCSSSPILNTDSLTTDSTSKETNMKIEDINWITIPGGNILFREQEIEVPEFAIMETLVTNAMWDQFLKDYENPEWWEFEIDEDIKRNIAPTWSEPDCPRENVNWYQAKAFTKWLSHQTGRACNLPTEQQWYYAATSGDPSNIYPWGPEWEDGRANTWEAGIRRTTPVKQYPQGATQHGVLDMCGNLWQWTDSEY